MGVYSVVVMVNNFRKSSRRDLSGLLQPNQLVQVSLKRCNSLV